MTNKRGNSKVSVAPKPNYNKLARNRNEWDKEARRTVMKLSNSTYAAAKVEPKPFSYREVMVWA